MGKGFKKSEPTWKTAEKKKKRAQQAAAIHADDKPKGKDVANKNAQVAKATGDQRYMNKLFMSLSAAETEGPPELDADEMNKLTDAAKERHMFLHQKAVDAYFEEEARKKAQAWRLLVKEDKFGSMSVADIIKEDPIAISAFRAAKTFNNINGLGSYCVQWNHNSTMIATTGHDRSLSLWRPEAVNGMPARKLKGHKGWTIQCCFSHDGKLICCCSSDEMYIWDPTNGTLKAEWPAHDAMINGCQFSKSGKYLVSCSNDLTSKVWLVKQCLSKGTKGAVHHHDDDEDDGQEHHDHGVPVEFHLPNEGERGHSGAVVKAAFAHDDSFVVTVGKDKGVIMWNLKLKGAKDREFKGHDDAVLNVAVNNDSTRFVTCDNSGKIFVWDPKVEHPVHMMNEHTDIVYCAIFGKEAKEGRGRIITAGHDSRILVWNCYEGTLIGEVQSKHKSWVTGISMDSSNMKLATVGMDSNL
eukprot:CAMPEP_0118647426 /NCGR_PEP_ID=MMETSP0785-20121206/8600_1 /TAXON_ID=91992 /ORGANISM="Bolidomonas pacifica, Strain CCMP 1866" /LENGTH=467 /DNA_ID=CAMNT_0006539519 /DNA_START=285 /DNA_END=1685 /DNA_ORIENTATION=-